MRWKTALAVSAWIAAVVAAQVFTDPEPVAPMGCCGPVWRGQAVPPRDADAGAVRAPTQQTNETPETVAFETLSNFPCATPAADAVPQRVRDLDGRRVAVDGYVIPLDAAGAGCSRFILASFVPSCCFGDTIRPNQWIQVEMTDGRRIAYGRGPTRVVGVLEVAARGSPESATPLYRMSGEAAQASE